MSLTADRKPPSGRFVPGDPRRINKPKGSRQKLATTYFNDLYGLWEEQGEAVLRRAAFEKPMEFAAMVAKLMPAKIEISTPTAGMTDERFEQLLELAETQLRLSAEKAGQARLPSTTIEGSAVEVEGGRGDPHEVASRGEVVDHVHYSADYANPLSPSPGGAAPTGEPPTSSSAETPDDEEVDPASLF